MAKMQQKTGSQLFFQKIGKEFQCRIVEPDDLLLLKNIETTLFAAIGVPVKAIEADPEFLKALDVDGGGNIRADEFLKAVDLLAGVFGGTLKPCAEKTDYVDVADVKDAEMLDFIALLGNGIVSDGKIRLELVDAMYTQISGSALRGDGNITPSAAATANLLAAKELIDSIIATMGGTGATAATAEAFRTAAKNFIEWASSVKVPEFRGQEAATIYPNYLALRDKIDEYFSYCDLVRIDQANRNYFVADPEKLPELDINSPVEVDAKIIASAIAPPVPGGILALDEKLNPAWLDKVKAFFATVNIVKLDIDEWKKIKADFAPYEDFLGVASSNVVHTIPMGKLTGLLEGQGYVELQKLLEDDGKLGYKLDNLKKLSRILRIKAHILEFADNFVNFSALFDVKRKAMAQYGKILMGGRTFILTSAVLNIDAHKKIAGSANLCVLYFKITPTPANINVQPVVACVVTAGSISQHYIGKPAIWVAPNGEYCGAELIDRIEGPISFWQSVFMPFRKLFSLIGDKFKKLSGIDDVDKHIGGIIDGKLPNLPAAAPATGKPGAPLNPTSLMLIATVGFAAVGSFLALMVKTLSDMGLKKIALAVLILGLILLVPAMIFAAIKLHRRDYGRFLEGSGWVINMPMLLTLRVSGAFSRRPPLPKGAKKDYSDVMNQFNSSVNKEKEPINWPAMIFYIIVILTVLGVGGYYFYNSYYLPKHKKAPTECMESSAETQQPTVEEVAPELEAPVPDVVIPATKIEQ